MVSQFTLLGDVRHGPPARASSRRHHRSRPSRSSRRSRRRYGRQAVTVATGRFGAQMRVELVNDGPVTIVLDSADFERPRALGRRPDQRFATPAGIHHAIGCLEAPSCPLLSIVTPANGSLEQLSARGRTCPPAHRSVFSRCSARRMDLSKRRDECHEVHRYAARLELVDVVRQVHFADDAVDEHAVPLPREGGGSTRGGAADRDVLAVLTRPSTARRSPCGSRRRCRQSRGARYGRSVRRAPRRRCSCRRPGGPETMTICDIRPRRARG